MAWMRSSPACLLGALKHHLNLTDADSVAFAQLLGCMGRDTGAIQHGAVGTAQIYQGVEVALKLDAGVVARGDTLVVLGQIQFWKVVAAWVTPTNAKGQSFQFELPCAAWRFYQQASNRLCIEGCSTVGTEACAGFVHIATARAGDAPRLNWRQCHGR